jgi:hypothetical protein
MTGTGMNSAVHASNLSSQPLETSHTLSSNSRNAYDGNLKNRDTDSTLFTFSFAERENLDKLELSSDVFKTRKLESVEEVATYRTTHTSTSSTSIVSNNNATYQSPSDAIFTYWPDPSEMNDGSSTDRIDIDRAIATMTQPQAKKSHVISVASPSIYDVDDSVESQFNRYVRFNSSAVNRNSSNQDDQHQVLSAEEPLLRKEEMRKLMMERVARLKLEKLLRDKELAGLQHLQKNSTASQFLSEQSSAFQTALGGAISGVSAAAAAAAGEEAMITRSAPLSLLQSDKYPQADEQVLRSALLRLRKRPFDAIESAEKDQANHAEQLIIASTTAVLQNESEIERFDVIDACPIVTTDQSGVMDIDKIEIRTGPKCSDLASNSTLDSSETAADAISARRSGANSDIFEVRKDREHEERLESEEDDEVILHRALRLMQLKMITERSRGRERGKRETGTGEESLYKFLLSPQSLRHLSLSL